MTAPATARGDGDAESTLGALSQLIQDANDSGITYQEMADRGAAAEPGSSLNRQWYQKLVKTPPVNPPNPTQMNAIAAAIGRPFPHVQRAVARQWLKWEAKELSGYDEEVRIIVGYLSGRPKSEQLRWRLMMEADEKARRESGD